MHVNCASSMCTYVYLYHLYHRTYKALPVYSKHGVPQVLEKIPFVYDICACHKSCVYMCVSIVCIRGVSHIYIYIYVYIYIFLLYMYIYKKHEYESYITLIQNTNNVLTSYL